MTGRASLRNFCNPKVSCMKNKNQQQRISLFVFLFSFSSCAVCSTGVAESASPRCPTARLRLIFDLCIV